ncbi:Rep [uncultured virus]|uniref:ATP-dependent helicase Rep n=1 Tax=uncultured virus TaxID=340016 RepID=A0A2K9LSX2_9VIRU|nr:Rep [uncultured virus]
MGKYEETTDCDLFGRRRTEVSEYTIPPYERRTGADVSESPFKPGIIGHGRIRESEPIQVGMRNDGNVHESVISDERSETVDGNARTSSKNWVYTINNLDGYLSSIGDGTFDCSRLWTSLRRASSTFKYSICQLERASTDKRHLQGYVEFTGTVNFKRLRSILPGVHFEVRRGTRDQARDYCKKEDTRIAGPWESNEWIPSASKKSDGGRKPDPYESIKTGILSRSTTQKEIAENHFKIWTRHFKAFERFEGMTTSHRSTAPEVYVLFGKPGTGKSTFARTLADGPRIYHKAPNKWWDGYSPSMGPDRGHSVVIFDDYSGSLPWTEWKLLCDAAPLTLEVKGATVNFNSSVVVFTTNKDPMKWYKWPFDPYAHLALKRRVTHWMIFERNFEGEFVHYDYGNGEEGWTKFNEHLCQIIPSVIFQNLNNKDE